MSFSYNPGDLATSKRDQVRLIIGDTNIGDSLLQDEEIDYILTQSTGVNKASSACCDSILAILARRVTHSIGPAKTELSDMFEHYTKLSEKLASKVSAGSCIVAPSIPQDALSSNTTGEAIFRVGMFDDI